MLREGKGDSRIKVLFMAITRNPRQMANQLQLASKLMQRRFTRLPFVAKCSMGLSLVLSAVIYGSIFLVLLGNHLKKESFLEMSKCPACYGTSACENAKNGKVWFVGWSKIRFLDYVNVNNIYYGTDSGGQSLLVSKLGSDSKIASMEKAVCALAKEPEGCDVSRAAGRAFPPSGTKWMLKQITGMSTMTTCPSDRLLEMIIGKYHEKNDAISISASERAQLMTTLMVNQEPIVFQTFPKLEGWPFPGYMGACGRFVMTESIGMPLNNFYSMPFKIRATLALKLLGIARQFTENEGQYALYWTELSYSTFVVDETGNLLVSDGRHILVVDLWQIKRDKNPGWDEACYSNFDSCADSEQSCSLTIPDCLCSAHMADHNYYAVCRNILSSFASHNGVSISLLHNIPSDVEELYHIRELADKCARPNKPRQRQGVVEELVKVLKEFIGPQLT